MAQAAGERIGGYELLEKLGEGGMAEVWKARSVALERVVAIKFLLERFSHDPELQQRFLQEGRIQARLQHPQIVSVWHADAENGRAYLVTDYVAGQTLEQRLQGCGGKALPAEEVLSISYDVLGALQYAHTLPQGAIVHRDVKPSNILLDQEGRARLADFGIAVAVNEDRKTKTGYALGSVYYMSPEQIQTPRAIDWRSDIYSFGCVLYEMLTGRPPFGGETDSDFTIKQAHVQAPPEPMRKWNPQVPFEFEWIVFRALSKDKERRFSSATEMAEALRPIVPGKHQKHPRTPTIVESSSQEARRLEQLSSPQPVSRVAEAVQVGKSAPPVPSVQIPVSKRPFWKRLFWPEFSDRETADQSIKIAALMCVLMGLAILGNELGHYDRLQGPFTVAAILALAVAAWIWKRSRMAVIVALVASFLGLLINAGDAIDYMISYMSGGDILGTLFILFLRCFLLALIPFYVHALVPSVSSASVENSWRRIAGASPVVKAIAGVFLVGLLFFVFRQPLMVGTETEAPILVALLSIIALWPWQRWKVAIISALVLCPFAAYFFGLHLHDRLFQGSWASVFLLLVILALMRALRATTAYGGLPLERS